MVGVPVTLNGDLKNQFVEANVGFDTICKVCNFLKIHQITSSCFSVLSSQVTLILAVNYRTKFVNMSVLPLYTGQFPAY